MGGPEIRLSREGLDQLVPPPVGGGSPDIGLHPGTAERAQLEKHLPARGAGRLPESGPAGRRWASPISAPPTEAGTTSRIRRRALRGTRFLRNVDLSVTCPETRRDCWSRTRARSAASCSPARTMTMADQKWRPVEFLNLLAASWIQFMNHDWINHGDTYPDHFIRVPLDNDDPARVRYRQDRTCDRHDPARPDARRRPRSRPARVRSTRSPIGGTARRSTAATRTPRTACAAAKWAR